MKFYKPVRAKTAGGARCTCTALRAAAFKRGVSAVRQYRLSARRSDVGTNAYAVLYQSPAAPFRRVATKSAGFRPVPVSRSKSRARTVARRRHVLGILFAALAIPLLVALLTGSSTAWWVVIALLPVVCTYLFVLFRTRRLMAEREINLAFFGARERNDSGLEDVFSARLMPVGDELRAVGGARY